MDNPHQRKKEPELVRQRILENTIHLAAQKGVTGVSIQAVADLSGITKGGVFHHFPNKQKLLIAMIVHLLAQLDLVVERLILQDSHSYGCFTRAYIIITLEKNILGLDHVWSAICMTMLTEPVFNEYWLQWLNSKIEKYHITDVDLELNILRLAADGIWLAIITNTIDDLKVNVLKQELIQRSYKN